MPQNNRVRYSAAAVFVGPTPSTGQHFADGNEGVNLVTQLHRVQSFSDTFDNPIEDVLQFGQTEAYDQVSTTSPTPTFEITYRLTNGVNEQRLGLPIGGDLSVLSGLLDATTDEKNYFVLFTPEGVDAVADTDRSEHRVVALGNGVITNLSLTASVGSFAEGSLSIEGNNYVVHANSSGNNIPALTPVDGQEIDTWQYAIPVATTGVTAQPSVIRHGDITIEGLPGADLIGAKLNSAHLQSFTVDIPVEREPLERFGTQFSFARPLSTPINGNVSLDFNVNDLTTGSLAEMFNACTNEKFDFTINLKSCVGATKSEQFKIIVKGAYFENENNDLDIGSARNGSVSLKVPLGSKGTTDQGIFLSGAYANV